MGRRNRGISPTVESQSHGAVVAELASVLTEALPEMHVLGRCGVVLPGNRLRTPDLTVVTSSGTSDRVEDVPVLVVEVLSRSSWSEDTVVKSVEYVRAGVGQYWTVDPDERTLDADQNADGLWRMLLRLDDAHPAGEVVVGEHQVRLDLRRILGD